jgi:hypothetical protein
MPFISDGGGEVYVGAGGKVIWEATPAELTQHMIEYAEEVLGAESKPLSPTAQNTLPQSTPQPSL